MSARSAVLAVVVALATAACAGDDARDERSTPSTSTTTAAAPVVEGMVGGDVLHVLEVEDSLIVRLAMWDDYVAWASGAAGANEIDEVWLWDLETDRSRRIARSESPTGTMSWVRGDGHVVVFGDQTSLLSEDGLSAPWTMRLVDLRDDSVRTIASSRTIDDEFGGAPFPDIELPWVVWEQPEGQTFKIVAYNVDTGVSHIVRVAAVAQASIDGTRVVFTELRDGVSGAYELDVTTEGAEPRALGGGDVGVFYAGGGRAAWNGPRGADQQSVWVTSTTDGAAPEEIPPMKGQRLTALGADWLATYDTGSRLNVARIETGEVLAITDQPIDNAAGTALDGDRVVWRMSEAANEAIVVARLPA